MIVSHIVLNLSLAAICLHGPSAGRDTAYLKSGYATRINNENQVLITTVKDSLFKGIGQLRLKKHLVYKTTIDPPQYFFSKYIRGEIPVNRLESVLKRYKQDLSDTVKYSRSDLVNTVYVLSGVDGDGHRVIIVDENHNNDFSDDRKVVLDSTFLKSPHAYDNKVPFTVLNYQHVMNGKVVPGSIAVKAIPDKSLSVEQGSDEADLGTALQFSDYKYASVLEGKYFVYVKKSYSGIPGFEQTTTLVALSESPDLKQSLSWRHLNEDIPLKTAGEYLRFTAIEDTGRYITYDLVKSNHSPGLNAGQFFPDHAFFDYKNNRDIDLDFSKHKYTLVDFWGSWCGPCIEAMPELKKIYQAYATQHDINFIGIAYDEKDKAAKIKDILTEHGVEWVTYIDDKNLQEKSFEKMYHVYTYPTILVLDENKQVIYRSTDSGKRLEGLTQFLKKL